VKVGSRRIGFVRRDTISGWQAFLISTVSVIVGLIVFSLVFVVSDVSPLTAYREIFGYAFLSPSGFRLVLNRFIFLAMCTFAFLIPYRAGLWNIGMTGQLYMGGLAAYGVVYLLGGKTNPNLEVSAWLVLPAMIAAAAAAGALWAAIAGFLKDRWDVNEIVVTMMLNFVGSFIVSHMTKEGGPFMNRGGGSEGFPLPTSLRAPVFADIPFTALFVAVLAVALHLLFTRSSLGFQIRAFGMSPRAAQYAGIRTHRMGLLVFLLGGAIAGLAAYHQFAAVPGVYKIPRDYEIVGDTAFFGIICGLIAQGNALASLPVALLFAAASIGGRAAQGKLHLAFGLDFALMGVLMIVLVGFQFLYRYRLAFRAVGVETPPAGAEAAAEARGRGSEA